MEVSEKKNLGTISSRLEVEGENVLNFFPPLLLPSLQRFQSRVITWEGGSGKKSGGRGRGEGRGGIWGGGGGGNRLLGEKEKKSLIKFLFGERKLKKTIETTWYFFLKVFAKAWWETNRSASRIPPLFFLMDEMDQTRIKRKAASISPTHPSFLQ